MTMPHPNTISPVSERPRACPYSDYVSQQQQRLTACRGEPKDLRSGPGWRQMVMGFTCAGFVGLVMLVLGTVFIAETVTKQQPITVMLCVMGIVFGIIILVGTFFLGKVLISRKWHRCHNSDIPQGSQCFHTCSIIYSPSLDQLGATEAMLEPPPAYSSVFSVAQHQQMIFEGSRAVQDEVEDPSSPITMVLPPKYDDINKPLPEYVEHEITVTAEVPPYKETADSSEDSS